MTFGEIPNGARVFIDANIFIYHFGGYSSECRRLLERCARNEIQGFTSTFVLAEVLHRLMVAEAIDKGIVQSKNAVSKLAEAPELVRQLDQYNTDTNQISEMNLNVVSLTPAHLAMSEAIRKMEGLLTNDSLVVATMRDLGITALASADKVFASINNIQLYQPQDLKV